MITLMLMNKYNVDNNTIIITIIEIIYTIVSIATLFLLIKLN